MMQADKLQALIARWRASVGDEMESVDDAYVMRRCADQLAEVLAVPETTGNVIVENRTIHALRVSMVLNHGEPAKIVIYQDGLTASCADSAVTNPLESCTPGLDGFPP